MYVSRDKQRNELTGSTMTIKTFFVCLEESDIYKNDCSCENPWGENWIYFGLNEQIVLFATYVE